MMDVHSIAHLPDKINKRVRSEPARLGDMMHIKMLLAVQRETLAAAQTRLRDPVPQTPFLLRGDQKLGT